MHIHFIAIGGSAMHNLALALHNKGCIITGSDDEIFDPARSRLATYGLLPEKEGWFPEKITKDIDAIVLGMHARKDNPELLKAQELGVKVYSYPEFLYEQSKEKTRVVIAGSHGKTTITSMILHVMRMLNKPFDYMVGAKLEGFDIMVKLSSDAPVIILEGDEYLTSPIDPRPKFHVYKPDIALVSGIAWDHINVFPTFDIYVEQFRKFVDLIEPHGRLIYCAEDTEVKKISSSVRADIIAVPYSLPDHKIRNGKTILIHHGKEYPLLVFGQHNLLNIEGAKNVCLSLGIKEEDFYESMTHFKGAGKRLEKVKEGKSCVVYKDFAHSPSKLEATVRAMKEQYPKRRLVACMELHTFSSLTSEFLLQYAGCMDLAEDAIVYFNPHTIALKKLRPITVDEVKHAFHREDLAVYTSSQELEQDLLKKDWHNANLLLMSSGNFDGISLEDLAMKIVV